MVILTLKDIKKEKNSRNTCHLYVLNVDGYSWGKVKWNKKMFFIMVIYRKLSKKGMPQILRIQKSFDHQMIYCIQSNVEG